MRKIFCLLLILLGAGSADAQKKTNPTFTSVYTDLQRDCKSLTDAAAEARGGDSPSVCKGYGGYRISVGYSAFFSHFAVENAKRPQETAITLGTDCGDGEKVEWRLANGKPFAVIKRVGKYREPDDGTSPCAAKENRAGSTLVVKGLKGFEQIDFEIDGASANANEKAREAADKNYSKK